MLNHLFSRYTRGWASLAVMAALVSSQFLSTQLSQYRNADSHTVMAIQILHLSLLATRQFRPIIFHHPYVTELQLLVTV
jgi:hypothetical protein